MNHEKAIKKMDKVFRANNFTETEERLAKATILGILTQVRAYEITESQHLDSLLGHAFGSIIGLLAQDTDKERVGAAVNHFIDIINGEDKDEYQH